MSTSLPLIRFIRPSLPPAKAWVPFLTSAYEQRHFTNRGPTLKAFELALTAEFGAAGRCATVMCSATAGITASLQALGVRGPVACPAFTFPATLQAIVAAGCQPWLCDVDAVSWEMTPATITQALADGVKAVVHVRSLGFCRDLSAMEDKAAEANIPLVIDAAACLGGFLPCGRRVGGQGTVEVFSMHATKPFGIGEGGALFVPPEQLAKLIEVANFSLRDGQVTGVGSNAKMSDFQAAVGLAVMADFSARQAQRDGLFLAYERYAADQWGIAPDPARGRPAGQCYPLRLPAGLSNTKMVDFARRRGVELRSYYTPALHEVQAFTCCPRASQLANSAALSRQMVCLPLYADMTADEQGRVLAVVDDFRKQANRRPGIRQQSAAVYGLFNSPLS